MPTKIMKSVNLVVGLLVILAMLAACAAPAAAPAAQQPAAAPAAEKPAAAPAQGEEVTLTIQHWSPNMVETTAWWDEILRGFEAKHPGVKIVNNFIPFAQYLPTLTSQSAGDQLPDVFFGHVKAAELGRGGKSIDYKTVFDEAFFKGFYAGPMNQFTYPNAEGGTNIYALPWSAQLFGIFVNPKIMKELGLEPPETWDQLIEMAPKIREAGYTPLVWGNQARNVCPDFFLPLVTQNGGDVLKMDDSGKGWDGDQVVKAFELLDKLARAGTFVDGINAVNEETGWNIAFQGKAAMLYTGSWVPDTIDKTAPPEYASSYYVAKNPALAADQPHWTGDGSGEGWVVKKGPNQDMAIELVKYLFSDEVYQKFIKGSQTMPSRPAALDQVENEKVKLMTSWLPDGSDHILFGQGSWDAVSNACQAVLDGSLAPADAAKQVQKDVDATRSR